MSKPLILPRALPASVIAAAGQPAYRWLFDGPSSGFQRDTANGVDCYRTVENRGSASGGQLSRTGAAGALAPVQSSIGGRLAASFASVGGAGRVFAGPSSSGSPLAALHDPNTYCTVIAMLYVIATTNARPLCLTRNSPTATQKGFLYYLDSGNWRLLMSDGTSNTLSITAAASTGYQRTAIRKQLLAVDTKLNNSAASSGSASALVAGDGSSSTFVGAQSTASAANNFDGMIGEINIWLGTTSATALSDSLLTEMDNYLISAWGS